MATSDQGALILDPTSVEEKVQVLLLSRGSLRHNVQTAENVVTLGFSSIEEGVLISDTRGLMSEDSYFAAVAAGKKGSLAIEAFFRTALAKAA